MGVSRDERNLQQLRKIDSDVTGIACYSSHVVVYTFLNGAWKREGIEGALFVAERKVEPFYRIFIMNRIGVEDLVEDIDNMFEFEENAEFLLFKNSKGVRGIWFGKDNDRSIILRSLERLLKSEVEAAPTPYHTPPAKNNNVKVSKVNDDYDKFSLSKQQLKQVLLKLVKDDSFIDILHSEYQKSLLDKSRG